MLAPVWGWGGWRGVGPEVNKYEHVSSDHHQMSVPRSHSQRGRGGRYPGPMSGGVGVGIYNR